MVDLKGREKTLQKAYEMLKLASSLIYGSASGVEPFRVSKILNMMGKATYDDSQVLAVILGHRDPKDWNAELLTHSVKLLEAELKDNPDAFQTMEESEGTSQ